MGKVNKEFYTLIITMIVGGLVYSIVSFAYMHKTFPSKDVFQMVIKKLDNIERKVDRLLTE